MTLPVAQAYLYNAPSGVPGDITRVDESSVEPIMFAAGQTPSDFGLGLVYNGSGLAIIPTVANAATDFQGVLVREVPQIDGGNGNALTGTNPNTTVPNGICTRGYVSVVCAAGTPVRGGVVYLQLVANGGVNPGQFRADGTNSGNAVALTATQAEWASNGLDASNNAELRIAR